CGPDFIDGTSDLSHVVFSSAALASGEGDSPFEWSNGTLAPLGVLPDGSPAEGLSLGDGDDFRGAISNDGSRVVLSTASSVGGRIYMRDLALRKTVQLNVAEPACVALGKCNSS